MLENKNSFLEKLFYLESLREQFLFLLEGMIFSLLPYYLIITKTREKLSGFCSVGRLRNDIRTCFMWQF